MSEIELRKAELKDKDLILKMISLLYLDFYGINATELTEKQIKNGEYYVAELNREAVGTISLHQREDRMYIETIAVLKDFQGKGIGSYMIEFAKNYTKEKGLSILRICSFYEYELEEYYKRLGFYSLGKPGKYNNHKFHRFEIKL